MVVRLSDSQIAAFEAGGISQDQIGSMIASARSKGIGDDIIYNDLATRAEAFANYAGMEIKKMDRQVDQAQRDNMVETAEKLDALTKRQQAQRRNEPIEGAMMRDIRENGVDAPFFNNPTPNVAEADKAAYEEQQRAYQAGKDLNWAESFILAAGDNIMMSAEDFFIPEAEMMRAGAMEDNPVASVLGGGTGFVLGLGGKALKYGYKGLKYLGKKALGKEVIGDVSQKLASTAAGGAVKSAGRRALGFAARTAADAAKGTAQLAAQDAIRAASKDEEWRTYRMDARRYSDDFLNGLGWSALFGSAGSAVSRWRKGAKNASNRFGGVERIKVLQEERQAKIDNGMSPERARYEFERDLIGGLKEEQQKEIAYALKHDPAFRQYFNDIATTMQTDIERSAKVLTQREIKKATDDSMDAIKRGQKLGDVDFDTSADGLVDALGTKSAKNLQVGEDLAREGNIILTQDPSIHANFKAKTRKAAQMGDSDAYNNLIKGAEISDFPAIKENLMAQGVDINSPEVKAMAQARAKKLLDEGMDSVSDVNDMKKMIDRLESKADIQAGDGTSIGKYRKDLNETLETAFGDPMNPGNLSGKFRGYHNVKHFEKEMVKAHEFGKNLDPTNQAENLRNFLNAHGTATADEAIAITTAVKMGYLDKLKDLAKNGQRDAWKKAVNDAKKNPQLNAMFGGEKGIQEYLKAMEPEVKAAQSLRNIMLSSMPNAQSDKMAQEVLGTVISVATHSPIAASNRLMRIWDNIAPGGVTPAVGQQMREIMENPTWNNFNKFINVAAKDPVTRQQLNKVVDTWFHEMSQGLNIGFRTEERYGTQNTPAFTGGR